VLDTYGKRYTLVPELQSLEKAAAGGKADALPDMPASETVPETLPPEPAAPLQGG